MKACLEFVVGTHTLEDCTCLGVSEEIGNLFFSGVTSSTRYQSLVVVGKIAIAVTLEPASDIVTVAAIELSLCNVGFAFSIRRFDERK